MSISRGKVKMNMNQAHMRRAIALSEVNMRNHHGGPFGAVIVRDDRIIAEGCNRVTASLDPTAHAEIEAIRAACQALDQFQLRDCDIYTSCEPCPMCLSAIYWARLERIYYANTRHDAADIGFDDDFLYREIPRPPMERSIPAHRLLADEARVAFEAWRGKGDKIRY
jgi:tRNA(Arg) A34 adenosine deaminase TadA